MIPANRTPWPAVEYRARPEGDGNNPSDYSEWWDIPGIARFDSEADAEFVHKMASNYNEIVGLLHEARNTPALAERADALLQSMTGRETS